MHVGQEGLALCLGHRSVCHAASQPDRTVACSARAAASATAAPYFWPGLRVRRWSGPLTETAATTRPCPSWTGADTLATPSSRSSTLATHGPVVAVEHAAGAADRERQPRADRDDRAELAGRLDRLHAHPGVAVAHEELHGLAGLLVEPRQGGPGRRPHGHRLGRLVPEADEPQPEAEATVVVAAHEAVRLEGDREPVGRRAAQPGGVHQLGQRAGRGLERGQHRHRLVEHADTA